MSSATVPQDTASPPSLSRPNAAPNDPNVLDRTPRTGEQPKPSQTAAPVSSSSEDLPLEQRKVIFEKQGELVRNNYPAQCLRAVLNAAAPIGCDVGVFRAILDQDLVQAGNPTDPIERSLIERITIVSNFADTLMNKASRIEQAHFIAVYMTAATKMLGEFRRLVAALSDYRASAAALLGKSERAGQRATPAIRRPSGAVVQVGAH